MNSLEVLVLLDNIGLDGLTTLSPVSRANLTVLLVALVTLDDAEHLVNVTLNGRVVHREVTNNTVGVDDVGSTAVVTIANEALVILTNGLGKIGSNGESHASDTTLGTGNLGPSMVSKDGVNRAENNGGVDSIELSLTIRDESKSRGTSEGESKGVYG